MKTLLVLMSAYCGKRYIVQQLDSIFSQKTDDCSISVLIRDDGSKDDTVKMCNEYADKNGVDVKVVEGKNVGPSRSFLDLIRTCPDADYYAFCDQDDVWLPGKAKAALVLLSGSNPVLWVSNYNVVDEQLSIIKQAALSSPEPDPFKVLFYNNVPYWGQ